MLSGSDLLLLALAVLFGIAMAVYEYLVAADIRHWVPICGFLGWVLAAVFLVADVISLTYAGLALALVSTGIVCWHRDGNPPGWLLRLTDRSFAPPGLLSEQRGPDANGHVFVKPRRQHEPGKYRERQR